MHNSLKSKLPEVADLLKQHKVKAAYVFGSVLTDDFNPGSDIDLLDRKSVGRERVSVLV